MAVVVLLAMLMVGVALPHILFVGRVGRRPVPEVFAASRHSPLVFLPLRFCRWIAVAGGSFLALRGGGEAPRPLVGSHLLRFARLIGLVCVLRLLASL
jgi:hypothetical protein